MARLILLLAVAALVYWVLWRLRSLPGERRRQWLIQCGLWALAGLLLLAAVTGRMHWLGALVAALLAAGRQLLPLLVKIAPAAVLWFNQRRANGANDASARNAPPPMDRQTALQILGLSNNPSADEITTAHRQLMQKLHPDKGGNAYLASQLNAARDFLLGQ